MTKYFLKQVHIIDFYTLVKGDVFAKSFVHAWPKPVTGGPKNKETDKPPSSQRGFVFKEATLVTSNKNVLSHCNHSNVMRFIWFPSIFYNNVKQSYDNK